MKEVWAGGLGSLCFEDVPGFEAFDGVLGICVAGTPGPDNSSAHSKTRMPWR